jgi:hypothetical protein
MGGTMKGSMKSLILAATFLTIVSPSFGANVFVPAMDLTTFFSQDGDLRTRGQFDIELNGGYKYQAKVAFQYLNPTLESDSSPTLVFDGAQATIRQLFKILDLTYWTGYYDVIGGGDYYVGYLYHREEGFEYLGYLPLKGTGVVLGTRTRDERYGGKVYTYQRDGVGYVNSFDLEFNLDTDPFLFNAYAGESDLEWRAGVQLKYLGDKVSFYLTVGHLTLSSGNALDFDEYYFLMEERFSAGNWNFIPSIFARPKYHYNYDTRNYEPTNETNDVDFNFNINYEPQTKNYAVGTELSLQTNKTENFGIYVSPYVDFYTLGMTWSFKIDINAVSEVRGFVTGYLNVSASF